MAAKTMSRGYNMSVSYGVKELKVFKKWVGRDRVTYSSAPNPFSKYI
jgi:hypothetical protein